MKISEISITKSTDDRDWVGASAYVHVPLGLLAEDDDASEKTGWFFEGYDDDDCPLVGFLTEDGKHCVDTYLPGTERLRVFLHWVAIRYGEECSPEQLRQYWQEFEHYEMEHGIELYMRPVDEKRRHLYATWAQVEEYRRGSEERWAKRTTAVSS